MHDAARLTIQAAKERLYDLMTRLEDASADLDREEAGAARVALDAMERPLRELDTLRRSAAVLLG